MSDMSVTATQSFLGGAFIAWSISQLARFNGSVLGCSGLLHGTFAPASLANASKRREHLAGILGILHSGVLAAVVLRLPPPTLLSIPKPFALRLLSGFLVGVGSKLQNGCTSGHMISGLSRLSPRSIVATIVFNLVAMLTARHVHANLPPPLGFVYELGVQGKLLVGLQLIPFLMLLHLKSGETKVGIFLPMNTRMPSNQIAISQYLKTATERSNSKLTLEDAERSFAKRRKAAFATGLSFGLALMLSNLSSPIKVIGYLLTPLSPSFNASLLFLALGAIPLSLYLSKHPTQKKKIPILGGEWSIPSTTGVIDVKLILGAILSGIGWGLEGICPGPGIVGLGLAIGNLNMSATVQLTAWLAAMILGGKVAQIWPSSHASRPGRPRPRPRPHSKGTRQKRP